MLQNSFDQIALWSISVVEDVLLSPTFKTATAILLGVYMTIVLVRRFRSGTDPSFRYQNESSAGTTSFLLSGVHVTLALAGAIALITWPLVVNSLTLAILLGGAIMVHFTLEKREAR